MKIQNPLAKLFKPSSQSSSLNMASSNVAVVAQSEKKSALWDTYLKVTDTLTTLFPLWTVLFAGIALKRPETFNWYYNLNR
jgi:hypothetical protein